MKISREKLPPTFNIQQRQLLLLQNQATDEFRTKWTKSYPNRILVMGVIWTYGADIYRESKWNRGRYIEREEYVYIYVYGYMYIYICICIYKNRMNKSKERNTNY